MATETLDIRIRTSTDPSGLNNAKKGVDDLSKHTESVRKNSLFRSDRAQAQGLLNLSRQGSDVFTQAITGTSPFTILVQQGPQVLDILASGALSAGKFAAALGGMGAVANSGSSKDKECMSKRHCEGLFHGHVVFVHKAFNQHQAPSDCVFF